MKKTNQQCWNDDKAWWQTRLRRPSKCDDRIPYWKISWAIKRPRVQSLQNWKSSGVIQREEAWQHVSIIYNLSNSNDSTKECSEGIITFHSSLPTIKNVFNYAWESPTESTKLQYHIRDGTIYYIIYSWGTQPSLTACWLSIRKSSLFNESWIIAVQISLLCI